MRRTNGGARRFRLDLGGLELEGRALLSTFTVSNLNDSGVGSLRNAVQASNVVPGADTITFAPGLTGEIHLTSGQLDLADNVTILGPGASKIAVSGNTSRIFETHGITATITGLTLLNGLATTADRGPGSGGDGGAIQEDAGVLNLANDVFVNDQAADRGGAVYNAFGVLHSINDQFLGDATPRQGGAIYNAGQLTSVGDRFVGNVSGWGGGALENGRVLDLLGGPSGVTATVVGDQFSGNSSALGGAISNEFAGAIAITNTSFTANHASLSGGAFFNGSFTGATSATVSNSSFTSNTAVLFGGAIQSVDDLTLSFSTLQFNTASQGGAVWAVNGTFTPIADTIQFNSAPEVFLA